MMEIRVLGCSGGIGAGLRTTSLLIDDDILIDAGTGVGELTLDEMAGIRHVFLTHTHLDHIACLPLMVDSIFERIKQPVLIHAQPESIDALKKHIFNWSIWPDFTTLPTAENAVLGYKAFKPGETYTLGGRTIEMIPVNHIIPAVGYRVTCESGSFAFSGDTTTNDSFWNALNRHDTLDLLLVEAAFTNEEKELSIKARHYCPELLAEDLKKLKHQPRVYLSHSKPGDENVIYAECKAAIIDRELLCLSGNQIFQL